MEDREKINERSFLTKLGSLWNNVGKDNLSLSDEESNSENVISSSKNQFLSVEKASECEITLAESSRELDKIEHESKASFYDTLKDFSVSKLNTVRLSSALAWDFTLLKSEEAKKTSVELSQSLSNTFVEFSTEVGKKYDDLEIKPKLLNLIYAVDLSDIINSAQEYKDKQKSGSKEKTALSVVIGILYLLEKSKLRLNSNENTAVAVDDHLNQDFESLLKSITLKDVVETVEPFLLIIPNGNYILLILKLLI